ncbi:HK97 gp10 family phage protein [Gemmobacter lanyuensis]
MVQGLNELNRRWTAIPKKVRDAVRVEMEKAADDVVATMRRFAPVDTGALRESIGWTWGMLRRGR